VLQGIGTLVRTEGKELVLCAVGDGNLDGEIIVSAVSRWLQRMFGTGVIHLPYRLVSEDDLHSESSPQTVS
jgi:hypothetical protein